MITRSVCLASLVLTGCAVAPRPANEPNVSYSEKQTLDVLEAALRHRLMSVPLPSHARCYVFIESGHVSTDSFARRFPEYRFIVRTGSRGNSPAMPWRSVWLGKTAFNHAWVIISDPVDSIGYQLRLQKGRWVVTAEEPPISI